MKERLRVLGRGEDSRTSTTPAASSATPSSRSGVIGFSSNPTQP